VSPNETIASAGSENGLQLKGVHPLSCYKMNDPQPFPKPHVILPTSNHTHTIVLLHGRGSNAEEFAEELFEGESSSEQTLPQHFSGFKWVFPCAHPRFSTVFGEEVTEWFDVYSLADPSEEEEIQVEGLRESVAFIHGLIANEGEILGHSRRDRIILGGISQGCAVGITALLSGLCGIGAFVGFNGWLPLMDSVKEALSKSGQNQASFGKERCERLASSLRLKLGLQEEMHSTDAGVMLGKPSEVPEPGYRHTPIFLSHTVDDEVIDVALGKQMRNRLFGIVMHKVVWKEYEHGGHWIAEPEGFEDIVQFLSEIVAGHGQEPQGE
jgi:lysophospholipase II